MKINVKTILTDVRGKPLKRTLPPDKEGREVEGDPFSLGEIVIEALDASVQADTGGQPDDTMRRRKLGRKIAAGVDGESGEVDLTPEEVTLIRDRIVKTVFQKLAGASLELLDT